MNFSNYKDDLAEEFGITKDMARRMISFLLKRMEHDLFFGIEITFRLIGTLKLRKRMPKRYQNLQTGAIEWSKKSYYLSFKATERMANKLKSKTIH